IEGDDLTVVAIFHDLNIASLYCNQVMLLNDGKVAICDKPEVVLQPERINTIYHTKVENFAHTQLAKPQVMLIPESHKKIQKNIELYHSLLEITVAHIILNAPVPLRTMSSDVLNSGLGWYNYFINRHVDVKYKVRDYKHDMRAYLQKYNMQESETVAMMTAVNLKNVGIVEIKEKDYSLMIVATAGVRNAIDATDRKSVV